MSLTECLAALLADPLAYVPTIAILTLGWLAFGRDESDGRLTVTGALAASGAIGLGYGAVLMALGGWVN